MWDRNLVCVCVSGGCVVWNSIIRLFMPNFELCLELDFLNIISLVIQGVPLATEPSISLIILPLISILQRYSKRTYLIV